MKPLSRRQIQVLIQVSREAFSAACARGDQLDGSRKGFDAWRHAQVLAACGRTGLRSALNDDYLKILARFQSLLGEDGKALNALLAGADERRRQNEWVLVREMQRAGLGPAYVSSICRAVYKCCVQDATADQLQKLTYTVRNRAAAKRRSRIE